MKAWAKEVFDDVVERMPYIAVGDVWANVPAAGYVITIEKIEPDDVWPFPMVHFRVEKGEFSLDPRAGAAMFLFGVLVQRGHGERWPR